MRLALQGSKATAQVASPPAPTTALTALAMTLKPTNKSMVTAYRLLTCVSTLRWMPTLLHQHLRVTTTRSCTLVDARMAASTITILCSLLLWRCIICMLLVTWDTRLCTLLMRFLTFSWRPVVINSSWFTMIKTCSSWLYHLMEFGTITILNWI